MYLKYVAILFIISIEVKADCNKIIGHFSYQKRNPTTSKIQKFTQSEPVKKHWEANDQAYDKISVSDKSLKEVTITVNKKAPVKYKILNKFIHNFSFKDHVLGKPKPFSINFKFSKNCQHKIFIRKGD